MSEIKVEYLQFYTLICPIWLMLPFDICDVSKWTQDGAELELNECQSSSHVIWDFKSSKPYKDRRGLEHISFPIFDLVSQF